MSKLSTESHEPIPEMNVQTHVVFPQLVIKCCKRSKNRANLEAKLGALKEMISEGWLTHIQQHLTLLKPNWPFRDQIASEDRIFTKSPPSYHSYDSAEIYFRQTPQTTQSNTENQAKSKNLCWRKACNSCEELQHSQQKELLIPTDIPPGHGIPLRLIFLLSIQLFAHML